MLLQPSATRRITETPNGVMTTLASPTLGGAAGALWQVQMHPGAVGPVHAFDCEVIWAFTTGQATVAVRGETHAVGGGDTIVFPAGESRQLTAGPEGFEAVVSGRGGATVVGPDGGTVVPAWVV